MKNVIIDCIYAVGMHHWGSSQLQIDAAYKAILEPDNVQDPKAVAVYDGNKRVAYLCRAHAANITYLVTREPCLQSAIYLKPKEAPEVESQRQGPRQRCTIGFKVQDVDHDRVSERVEAIGLCLRKS